MAITLTLEKSKRSGRTYLIADTKIGAFRKKQSLKLSFVTNPSTEIERQHKKETIAIAKQIVFNKNMELVRGEYEIEEQFTPNEDFIQYANSWISQHKVVELKKYYSTLKKFIAFIGKRSIPCHEITQTLMRRYAKYLENQLNGETASNYFAKLKQIINSACEENYFRKNPTTGIKVKQSQYIQKEVLTIDELRILAKTPIGNDEVRRAFLFSTKTGLRFCDVYDLKWKDVKSDRVSIIQRKTKVCLEISLNNDTLSLIGERQKPDEKVFKLPSHTSCLKWLRKWTESAGVDKHITYHSGRHTFGTNLIIHGVDVSIASKLLGHTSLSNTQRYVRISEAQKAESINKLPNIF